MTTPFDTDESSADNDVIALWHGSLSSIPDGWVLADGNNGSPDLRDRFLKGAGSDPYGTGGQHTTSLTGSQMPSHSHSGTLGTSGSHNHSIGVEFVWQGNGNGAAASGSDTVKTDAAGSHTHGGSTATAGSGNGIDNRPPFYELAYIYKL